jgi:hypothetical protein
MNSQDFAHRLMNVLWVVIVVALLAVACTTTDYESADVATMPEITTLYGSTGTSVYRFTDRDAGVVCWIYSAIERGGIDCLPLSDTRLEGY